LYVWIGGTGFCRDCNVDSNIVGLMKFKVPS
jgi:hypothetical protein